MKTEREKLIEALRVLRNIENMAETGRARGDAALALNLIKTSAGNAVLGLRQQLDLTPQESKRIG